MAIAIKSTKRFGARYGRKLKERFGKIEETQRKKHVCPYCRKLKVKRVALGIWHCQKCDAKFTGKAYSIDKKFPKEDVKRQKEIADVQETAENPAEDANKGSLAYGDEPAKVKKADVQETVDENTTDENESAEEPPQKSE